MCCLRLISVAVSDKSILTTNQNLSQPSAQIVVIINSKNGNGATESFSFHRLMNSVLSRLLGKSVFCYLDDIIASTHISDNFAALINVFSRLSEAGLKV